MEFKIQPPSPESKQKTEYVILGEKLKEIKLNRDDVLQDAALILSDDPQFPNKRGEKADFLRAKKAIREVLKKHSKWNISDDLENQISKDAQDVLNLFK